MANSFLQTCCLIVLMIFVESGDGRWKKKDEIQHDIELFRKMADKIQHELEDTYDEYSSSQIREKIFDSLLQKYRRNPVSYAKNFTKYEVEPNKLSKTKVNNDSIFKKHTTQSDSDEVKLKNSMIPNTTKVLNPKVDTFKTPRWPKFEDILLEVGKKYDWKNDRWIKVKGKLKTKDTANVSENSVEFSEKHKFQYRIVKLNKSKSRRNVVVAVSAVR